MAQSVRSTRRTAGAKKSKRALSSGQVHIFASFNNTIVTVTIVLLNEAKMCTCPDEILRLTFLAPAFRRVERTLCAIYL